MPRRILPILLPILTVTIFLGACETVFDTTEPEEPAEEEPELTHTATDYPTNQNPPEWIWEGAIYEVFVRNIGEDGTFAELEEELPRIKELGVKTLWLMPIHPIGEEKRKGPAGSPYSVQDFYEVHPDYGTKEDFHSLRETAHELDMKIILDWVANHTAHDHEWTENPEWYIQDQDGEPRPPIAFPEWWDIAALDYSRNEPREVMTDAIRYWVEEMEVDGFRFDYPGDIPMDYWGYVLPKMQEINPDLFLLAETGDTEFITDGPFHMLYGWSSHFTHAGVWTGDARPHELVNQAQQEIEGTAGSPPMRFITNHDETSWTLNPVVLFGNNNPHVAGANAEPLLEENDPEYVDSDGSKAAAVAQLLLPGVPMLYNAQEIGSVDAEGRLVGHPFDDEASNDTAYLFTESTYSWDDLGPTSERFQEFYTALLELRNESRLFRRGDMRIPDDYSRNDELVFYARTLAGSPEGSGNGESANESGDDSSESTYGVVVVNPTPDPLEADVDALLERAVPDAGERAWSYRAGHHLERGDISELQAREEIDGYEWWIIEEM